MMFVMLSCPPSSIEGEYSHGKSVFYVPVENDSVIVSLVMIANKWFW
jgi:hypothetical protein